MNKTKTIFCDIDGTLFVHNGNVTNQILKETLELLPNSLEAINHWEKLGYNIILTTGRKESCRQITEKQLNNAGIHYDQLIMGIGGGVRVLINDKKDQKNQNDNNTAYSINVVRNKGIHFFDFDSKFVTVPEKQPEKVIKPWGYEELLEYNENYIMKRLFMKENESCSMQYHELKKETIYVLSGKVRLYIGTDINNLEIKELSANENITISPYTIHKMEAIVDSLYLECSTPQLWDVIRLQDKYNRQNTIESDYKL